MFKVMQEQVNLLKRMLLPIMNPSFMVKGIKGFLWYFADWYKYRQLPFAERVRWVDAQPQLHDRVATNVIDPHYFFCNGWAMRRIVSAPPQQHVDIASQTIFVNLLGAVIPTIFLDYRSLTAKVEGLQCVSGSLLSLPFKDQSIHSLSCLHVVEHIGLGRYGDPLDPLGTFKALGELSRVTSPGGNLFLALPVGKPRTCFNAHRIFLAEDIFKNLREFELVEFSGVDDRGTYFEDVKIEFFDNCEYACGFFWLRRLK